MFGPRLWLAARFMVVVFGCSSGGAQSWSPQIRLPKCKNFSRQFFSALCEKGNDWMNFILGDCSQPYSILVLGGILLTDVGGASRFYWTKQTLHHSNAEFILSRFPEERFPDRPRHVTIPLPENGMVSVFPGQPQFYRKEAFLYKHFYCTRRWRAATALGVVAQSSPTFWVWNGVVDSEGDSSAILLDPLNTSPTVNWRDLWVSKRAAVPFNPITAQPTQQWTVIPGLKQLFSTVNDT